MENLLQINGIQCDNINCSYEDDSVTFDQYEDYLNKPCPNCGANLLTQADLNTVMALIKIYNNPLTKAINKLFTSFGSKETIAEVKMNGSGMIKIEEGHTKKGGVNPPNPIPKPDVVPGASEPK